MHSIATSLSRYWPFFLAAVSVVLLVVTKGLAIVKDWCDVRKAQLEREKLLREIRNLDKNSSNSAQIQLALLEDVIRYDDKVRMILRLPDNEMLGDPQTPSGRPLLSKLLVLIVAIVAIVGVALLVYIVKK